MRTALYARVSMKDKRQDTENQLSQLRQFCESQGWAITHEYVDRASGKRSDREQFLKMFEDASQRKFDVVLFWSLDRFSREGLAKARKQGPVGGRPQLVLRRDQVATLRAKGLSISKIAEKMEIPRTSVHRILKELAA
jgi:DNA invertase Pin-like site-specific DNA recombinase